MGTLSDTEIRQALEGGDISIEPLDDTQIEPASVDLTLGPEAFRASDTDKIHLKEGDILPLPPGEMALVLTREVVELSPRIAANIGLRSHFTRKGIDLLAGPQIDPGFEGPLHIILINLSPSELLIEYGEPFLTIEFRRLGEAAAERYDGQYQASTSITADEIRDLKKGEGIALSEAVKAMQTIAKDVGALQESVSELTTNVNRYMAIFVGAIVTLVAAVISALFLILRNMGTI